MQINITKYGGSSRSQPRKDRKGTPYHFFSGILLKCILLGATYFSWSLYSLFSTGDEVRGFNAKGLVGGGFIVHAACPTLAGNTSPWCPVRNAKVGFRWGESWPPRYLAISLSKITMWNRQFIAGWLVVDQPEKWWSEWKSVGMIFHSQYDGKVIKFMFQTTNQISH